MKVMNKQTCKTMLVVTAAAAALLSSSITGCGGGSGTEASGMTANINGRAFTANLYAEANYVRSTKSLYVEGANTDGREIMFVIEGEDFSSLPKTYKSGDGKLRASLGVLEGNLDPADFRVTVTGACPAADAQVVITSLTDTTCEGRFEFVFSNCSGTGFPEENYSVTDGSFRVRLYKYD